MFLEVNLAPPGADPRDNLAPLQAAYSSWKELAFQSIQTVLPLDLVRSTCNFTTLQSLPVK
jgi:hypothetical protein